MVRCPHCFSFITVPDDDSPQFKIIADEPPAEAPMIIFRCPYCQSRIETDPANAGLACMCPGCHAGLTIPGNARPIFLRPPIGDIAEMRGQRLERIPAAAMLAWFALGLGLIAALASWLRP